LCRRIGFFPVVEQKLIEIDFDLASYLIVEILPAADYRELFPASNLVHVGPVIREQIERVPQKFGRLLGADGVERLKRLLGVIPRVVVQELVDSAVHHFIFKPVNVPNVAIAARQLAVVGLRTHVEAEEYFADFLGRRMIERIFNGAFFRRRRQISSPLRNTFTAAGREKRDG
jgi:hypothetical protein